MSELQGHSAKTRGIEFVENCQSTPPILADEDKFARVFSNLLSNAFKFTPPGERIEVKVKEVPEGIYCSVFNSGSYISPKDQKQIFEKFYVASSHSYEGKGSGLGLSIARDIISHYGGNIWVESNEQDGTCFQFIIPHSAIQKAA